MESSYHPVEVRSFGSSLDVRTQHAPLRIATDTLGGEVKLSTSYGEVQLSLPPQSSFRLRAKVKGGAIQAYFPEADLEETRSGEEIELVGTVGGGASPIQIETSYADVEIRESSSQ